MDIFNYREKMEGLQAKIRQRYLHILRAYKKHTTTIWPWAITTWELLAKYVAGWTEIKLGSLLQKLFFIMVEIIFLYHIFAFHGLLAAYYITGCFTFLFLIIIYFNTYNINAPIITPFSQSN